MIHYYPLGRSIGMLMGGVLGLLISLALVTMGFLSFLLAIMSVVAVSVGVIGTTKRKRQPMKFEGNALTFYRRSRPVEVPRDAIEKIFYNRSGIDKRVTILTTDKKQIDIPTVYGLKSLARKLNKELDLP